MRTGRAVRRVGRDSEFAYPADPSTRILRFRDLEAEGGLRKILPIKLRKAERQPHQRISNG